MTETAHATARIRQRPYLLLATLCGWPHRLGLFMGKKAARLRIRSRGTGATRNQFEHLAAGGTVEHYRG